MAPPLPRLALLPLLRPPRRPPSAPPALMQLHAALGARRFIVAVFLALASPRSLLTLAHLKVDIVKKFRVEEANLLELDLAQKLFFYLAVAHGRRRHVFT